MTGKSNDPPKGALTEALPPWLKRRLFWADTRRLVRGFLIVIGASTLTDWIFDPFGERVEVAAWLLILVVLYALHHDEDWIRAAARKYEEELE